MLKYRITKRNMDLGIKSLNVTDVENLGKAGSEITDVPYSSPIENNEEVVFKFWADDIYTMQSDSHIMSVTDVVVNNEDADHPELFEHETYRQDLLVASASKAENCFTVNVKKEMSLSVESLHIETRFNAFLFYDNHWNMIIANRKWIDDWLDEHEGANAVEVKTTQAAYGENGREVLGENGELVLNNTVYYYENSCWKSVDLIDETLEGCLSGSTISLKSFHDYDNINRPAVKLDQDNLYYTRENYLIFDFASTHYFGAPYEEHNYVTSDDMEIPSTTSYGRIVVTGYDYPVIYLRARMYSSSKGTTTDMKIKTEAHAENPTRLVVNYDTFQSDSYLVETVTEEDTTLSEIVPMTTTVEKETQGISDSDMTVIQEAFFPYGYTIDENEDISYQDGVIGGFLFSRANLLYDGYYGTYTLSYDITTNTIQIPLSQQFETDLHHNDMLQVNFVDKLEAEMINSIADLEKDVYSPAIAKDVGEQINADYDDAYKIVFNLHFREHRDTSDNGMKEEWVCPKDAYWNGTRAITTTLSDDDSTEYTVLDLQGRVYNYDLLQGDENYDYDNRYTNKYDYFSYYGNVPGDGIYDNESDYEPLSEGYGENRQTRNALKEYQSDLASYLGFSNDDIRYQKSKVTKSFLRISFYDSDNVATQNLLHTATIFLNGGELYGKFIKNVDTEGEYKVIETIRMEDMVYYSQSTASRTSNSYASTKIYTTGNIITSKEYELLKSSGKAKCVINGPAMAIVGSSVSDPYTSYGNSGVRVNREPMRDKAIDISSDDLGDDIGDLEDLRISSQITVTDKYSSQNSSEGFYFYTYRTNDGGVFPNDIYMRVEFNHAGYGRTIPFMMPYMRKVELEEENGRYYNKENKIKTFDDICYDWSEIDFHNGNTVKDEEDVGYGTVKYIKYCHIKWKYRYDKNTRKHIYYLDPDTYGTGVTSGNGHGHNIILNLYEGKII